MLNLDEKEQFIKVVGLNGPIVSAMSMVWNFASKSPFPEKGINGLAPELDNLLQAIRDPFLAIEKPPQRPIKEGEPVLVGFSGGKDGLAAAIKVKQMGGEPVLFHVLGINRAYPDEVRSAEKLASELDVFIKQMPVQITGSSDNIESPIKNQFILAMMVEYGMMRNITNYTQGNLTEDTTKEQNLNMTKNFTYSDSIEMYHAMHPFLSHFQPTYNYLHLLKNDTDSLETIIAYDADLLRHVRSCVSPIRYREGFRKHNIEKYHVSLMPNRCGSCYKCALEWLHLAAIGRIAGVALSKDFVIHSVSILVRGLERIFGRPVTRKEACDNFLNEYSQIIQEWIDV